MFEDCKVSAVSSKGICQKSGVGGIVKTEKGGIPVYMKKDTDLGIGKSQTVLVLCCEGCEYALTVRNSASLGDWSPWDEWGECSVECGEGGLRNRSRACAGPEGVAVLCQPEQDGGAFVDEEEQAEACNQDVGCGEREQRITPCCPTLNYVDI